jgi:hypothetical protein
MQTATILLAIGGHQGNTVQKRGVTPAEVAVLIAIHGNAAVSDIEPDDIPVSLTGDNVAKRSDRAERARLLEVYGKPQNVNGQIADTSPVSTLFPGAAARVFHDFDELGLNESFFKAATRVKAKPGRGAKVEENDGVEEMDDADEPGESGESGEVPEQPEKPSEPAPPTTGKGRTTTRKQPDTPPAKPKAGDKSSMFS